MAEGGIPPAPLGLRLRGGVREPPDEFSRLSGHLITNVILPRKGFSDAFVFLKRGRGGSGSSQALRADQQSRMAKQIEC